MSEDKPAAPLARIGAGVRRYEMSVEGYGHPFNFTVALSDFMDFQREAQRDAAMATNNFLLRTATEPGRQELMVLLNEHWGLPGILMEKLAAEMMDMRAAALKNSKGA